MSNARQIAADIARLSSIHARLTRPVAKDTSRGLIIFQAGEIEWACVMLKAIIANMVDLIPEQPIVLSEEAG